MLRAVAYYFIVIFLRNFYWPTVKVERLVRCVRLSFFCLSALHALWLISKP